MQETLPSDETRSARRRVIRGGREVCRTRRDPFLISYASAKAVPMSGADHQRYGPMNSAGPLITLNLIAPGSDIGREVAMLCPAMDAYLRGVPLVQHGVPDDIGLCGGFFSERRGQLHHRAAAGRQLREDVVPYAGTT